MLAPAIGALGPELHHAARGHYRHDALHTEFRRLLHDEIHALAAGDALQQRDGERRLAFDGPMFADLREYTRAPGVLQLRGVLAAPAIEQHHLGAIAQPQYLTDVPDHLGRQLHELTGLGDMKANLPHGVAQSATARSSPSRAAVTMSAMSSSPIT